MIKWSDIFEVNDRSLLNYLHENLNAELEEVAKPFVAEAMAKINLAIRERIGSMLIKQIEATVCVDRIGQDIRIILKKEVIHDNS